MAVYKRDEDMTPYEVRGIDPDRQELSMEQVAQLMQNPNVRRGMETINRVEGKARLAQQIMVKAAKDLNQDGILQLDEVDPTPAFRVWTVSLTGLLKPPAEPEKPIKIWEEE